MSLTTKNADTPARASVVRQARLRMGAHLAAAGVVQVAMIVHVNQTEGLRNTWSGSALSASVILFAGLGVAILKEGLPALRHEKGDILLEPQIVHEAFAAASRDGVVTGALGGVVLLLIPWPLDASLMLFGLSAATFADFCVRQHAVRRRLNGLDGKPGREGTG